MPALNCNLDELGAAIGRAQLKKLPQIVASRQKFAALLAERCLRRLRSISIPALLPGAEHSYWWWRLKVNCDQITCSKQEYCKALQEEGVPLGVSYAGALVAFGDWIQDRPNKHPWNNPLYHGDRNRQYPCPNGVAATNECFNLTIYESWGEKEAELLSEAFRKVDAAFAK